MADVDLLGDELRDAAEPVLKELGGTNQKRLKALLDLFAQRETVPLSEIAETLFPDATARQVENHLKNFRTALAAACEAAGVRLTFPPDPNKNTNARICRFQGPSATVREVERRVEDVTAATPDNDLARGVPTRSGVMAAGKTPITIFVSYAHKDRRLKEEFLERLDGFLRSAKDFQFSTWNDRQIEIGADWHDQITKALDACDLGLFLASPDAFASTYIKENELQRFFGEDAQKPGIPVALKTLDFQNTDLRGLQSRQLFFQQNANQTNIPYSRSREKERFIAELFARMCEKLKSGLPAQAIAESAVPATPENDEDAPNNDRSAKLADVIPIPQSVGHYQDGLAERTTTEAKGISPESDGAHVAIDELMVWARRDPKNVEPFLAILGEYGIGKTTLLQTFARRLKAERATDPSLPVPVYIDLRLMSVPAEGEMPSLKELLSGFIHNCWKSSGNNDSSLTPDTLTPDSVIRLVREHNAIVIFDGLDEKTTAMRPERAQQFLRRLWSCLPDAALRMRLIKDKQKTNEKVVRTKAVEKPATRGRMIISCRSHYFRDITSQSSMLRGENREQIDGYPALILVPWNEQTIRNYLAERLGSEERSANAISLIKSVHNLRDLAERPYLLHLITGNLGELERAASEGETINAARLYQMITGEWLERDQGKHQISRPHKKLLMEQLALALHREGERSWDVDKLEDWLDEFLIQNPAIERNAAVSDVRILKEDLRAATFVVRPDQQDGNRFQFAHTSLQEFFLASALVDSLDKQDGSAWDLPRVSHETFDFVGQLIEVASPRERERMLETLGNVMGREPFKAAELAFRYWLRAMEQHRPVPRPTFVRIPGINLDEHHIGGKMRMDLSGADLSRATLRRATLSNVNLSRVCLEGTDLAQAILEDCDARDANWSGAIVDGVKWLGGNSGSATSEAASSAGFACRELPGAELTVSSPKNAARYPIHTARQAGFRLADPTHKHWVTSCAFSSDDRHVISAAHDNTLRLWDAQSGECLRTFTGHTNLVTSCAFSSDDRHVLSASDDHTLRLWDAQSGECLRTMRASRLGDFATVQHHTDGDELIAVSPGAFRSFFWDPMPGTRVSYQE